jgi:hypothetical protein
MITYEFIPKDYSPPSSAFITPVPTREIIDTNTSGGMTCITYITNQSNIEHTDCNKVSGKQ